MKTEDILRMAHDIIEKCAVESDCIEYKKTASIKDTILKTACAFANNYMNREIGLLFVGIEEEDDENTGRKAVPMRPISGIEEAKIETVENELKALLSHIHPKPVYHLLQDRIDDHYYIVLAVEPGNNGPYETSEKAEKDKKIGLKPGRYIRIRRDTRLPNKREEFELLKKFADFHFTSELNETATLDDLNYEYMKEYLVRTHAAADIRALSKLGMARSLNLICESDYGGYRAKNFAVLMFADRPADYIPYAYVQVIREAVGTDKMEGKIFDGPIWIQAQQVIRYFEDTFHASYNIRDPKTNATHVVDNWPPIMFAELATNCILHKEYSKHNCVEIAIFKDHISFINHNRPVPPVTIEDLNTKMEFKDRNYLNDELKEMFFKLDLIQSYGSGIRRAKNALSQIGSPALVFEPNNDTDDYTAVTAYINKEFAEIMAEEKGSTISGTKNKNGTENGTESGTENGTEIIPEGIKILLENYKNKKRLTAEKIIMAILSDSHITIPEIAKMSGSSERTVKRYLKEFQLANVLIREGSDASGEWILL